MHWCIFVFEDICFLMHWIIILCNVSINVLDSGFALSVCRRSGLLCFLFVVIFFTTFHKHFAFVKLTLFSWFVPKISGEWCALRLHVVLCVMILLLRRVVKLFLNIKIIISLRYCFECCVIFSIFANVLRKVVFCFLLNTIGQDANCNIKYNLAPWFTMDIY